MRFYELTDMGKLSPGAWGIPEPEEGKEGNGEEGLIVVPGVAFDQRLNRLGYGGGFYDRFLWPTRGFSVLGWPLNSRFWTVFLQSLLTSR